jgi:hypothetical protein
LVRRVSALEKSAFPDDHNMIVVLLGAGEGDVQKVEKIAQARRELGLVESDARQVIVVRFGADDNGRAGKVVKQAP